MKHEVIKTDNYLLIVDEDVTQAKEGCYIFRNDVGVVYCNEHFFFDFKEPYKKIIAHLPLNGAPYLDGVDVLPPLEDVENVEQIAEDDWDEYGEQFKTTPIWDYREIFVAGYNKAKETYKYTEEDMLIIRNKLVDILPTGDISAWDMIQAMSSYTKWFDNYIQSLQQPKLPITFECQTDYYGGDRKWVIETITNSQGRTEWVGKWIY